MRTARFCVITALCIIAVSCASSPPTPAGVRGQVVWGVTPLEGVTVKLVAGKNLDRDPAAGEAVTGKDGKFLIAGAAPGSYMVFALAPSADFSGWTGVPVTVNDKGNASAGALKLSKKMTIIDPPYGGVVTTTLPTLQWEAFPGAESYRVDVFLNVEPWTAVLRQDAGNVTSFTLPKALDPGQQYQWSVSAVTRAGGDIAYSAGNVFTVSR